MSSKPEFDAYAEEYKNLLADPLRDDFVQNADFFHYRKWLLIEEFFASKKIPLKQVDWLDVGCGKGELLNFGQSSFQRTVGCDPSSGMLEQGAAGGPVTVFKQEDPGILPFPDQSFDFITSVCVYHHIPVAARAAFTREIYRVLRPGGFFGIIEHNPRNPVTRKIVSRTPVDADAILLDRPETEALHKQAGFGETETRYFLFMPEKIFNVMGSLEKALAWLPLGGQYMTVSRKALR